MPFVQKGMAMADQKVKNRWLIVIGALLVQLCLGAIYAWSTSFTKGVQNWEGDTALALSPALLGVKDASTWEQAKKEGSTLNDIVKQARADLKAEQGKAGVSKDPSERNSAGAAVAAAQQKLDAARKTLDDWIGRTFDRAKFDRHVFRFSQTQTMIIFSVGLAMFALVMIPAGRWQDKAGPRIVALTGGLMLGVGYVLAGFLGSTSFVAMLICIGVLGGAGIGLGYVCPIAACVKWFPDIKGFVTGLAVAGFGAGAFFFILLSSPQMKIVGNVILPGANFVHHYGVLGTYMIFGAIFAVCVTIGGLLLSNPPAGWKPANWNPKSPGAKSAAKDLVRAETIRTPQFWMIWSAFVFGAGCGLMVIGVLKDFGMKECGLAEAAAGGAPGLLAIFNGLGRVVWGTISQKIGARRALSVMSILQAAMMFALPAMGGNGTTFIIAACWIGFNFGANFAIFPLLTNENFGSKNFGANYGAVFTAYGLGGIVGPILGGGIFDAMGTFKIAFIIAAVACLGASALGFAIKPPKVEAAEAAAPAKA